MWVRFLVFLPALLQPTAAQDPAPWNANSAEHLLNRAAFGGTPDEVAAAVSAGRDAVIERLLAGSGEPLVEPRPELRPGIVVPAADDGAESLEPGEVTLTWPEYNVEMGAYIELWIASMVANRDPLRDRMALLWHNHFVSSFNEVGDAHEMVMQATFLREHGLGDFRVLVDGISRDPAMLEYLNNNINVKSHPNENWARELMELFTLGEGNYTEDDIKEAARAFTGWTERGYHFLIDHVQHDFGLKTVLGVSGNLDGDLVNDILTEHEACGRWVAWKILTYFEGVEPDEARLADYAEFLRTNDYDLTATLRRLFQDPAFYREEIVGARITSPITYLVGATRRLGADVPPQMIFAGADLLGQRLLYPPSVKGWEGGLTWLPTAAVLNRSNVAGGMLGLLDLAWLKLGGGDGESETPRLDFKMLRQNDPMRMLVWIQDSGWKPEMDLARGLSGEPAADARVLADRLLALPVDDALVAHVAGVLREERAAAELADGEPYDTREARLALARTAHVILSLPEAMLD